MKKQRSKSQRARRNHRRRAKKTQQLMGQIATIALKIVPDVRQFSHALDSMVYMLSSIRSAEQRVTAEKLIVEGSIKH